MNITDMHINLRIELDKSDALDSVGFETEELDYWLNTTIRSFAKARYKGSSSARGEAFEQNQKRIDDLRTLIEEESTTISRGDLTLFDKPNSYLASLPSSNTYWFTLSEEVTIAYQSSTTVETVTGLVTGSTYIVSGSVIHGAYPTLNDGDYFVATTNTYDDTNGQVYLCTVKRQGITETTADTYTSHIDDPYSEHRLENYSAKPLRLFKGTEVELITDGTYGVTEYFSRYLFRPAIVDWTTDIATGSIEEHITYEVRNTDASYVTYNSIDYYNGEVFIGVSGVTTYIESGVSTIHITCNLPEHTHDEIVKMATDSILENTGNPRYQTHLIETSKSE